MKRAGMKNKIEDAGLVLMLGVLVWVMVFWGFGFFK